MIEDRPKLKVRTRSTPTAATMWLLTGVPPRVLRRAGDTSPIFEWDNQYESALQRYLAAKERIDRMVENQQ